MARKSFSSSAKPLVSLLAVLVAAPLAGCVTNNPGPGLQASAPSPVAAVPVGKVETKPLADASDNASTDAANYVASVDENAAGLYGAVTTEPFPVPAIRLSKIDPAYLRREVAYRTSEPPGTIVIDPAHHYLYLVEESGRAMRYGVGVGRQGFSWTGEATINSKQEWPDWYPPKEMIERQPELKAKMAELQSGTGMHGGPGNPLGARAMYLWQGKVDTLFRIHGTTEPWTIGKSVSSGCIRMINQDAMDLYSRTPVGTRVVVLGGKVAAR